MKEYDGPLLVRGLGGHFGTYKEDLEECRSVGNKVSMFLRAF